VGYRKAPTIYTLTDFPDDEGLVVRMKAVRLGKVRRLLALTSGGSDSDDGLMVDEVVRLLTEGMVSWNLEDEQGNPIEPNEEGIDGLELELALTIVNAWLDQMVGVQPDLGKDSSSGERFPGQPVTMEAL